MPRQRMVFPTDQVIHLWAAHNRGDAPARTEARSANVHFAGPALYSYRQEIARFDAAPDGTPFVWLNDHKYSVTTARHLDRASRALFGGTRRINLDTWRVAGDPREAIDHLLVAAQEHSDKAARKKPSASYGPAEYRQYYVMPRLNAAVWLGEKYGIPLGTLQMELRRMGRAKEGADCWRNMAQFFGQYEQAKEAIWRNIGKAMGQIDRGVAWLDRRDHMTGTGPRYQPYYRADFDLPTMLRLKADGATVETTRGAEFPLAHGLRVLPLIRACQSTGRGWERNADMNHPQRLGHFQVDRVTAEGDVQAGCHYVPWFAIEYLIRQLPVADYSRDMIEGPRV